MFYFAYVLKVKDHSINILIKALCMKCHPVNFKVKKNRDHSQFVPQYKSLFWMTQEKVDLEFFYHRKYLFSLTNEACPKTMKACYLNCWTTSESLRKPIRLEVMNDLPVIGSLCLRGVLGSAQNKHCKSSERNVWREVV